MDQEIVISSASVSDRGLSEKRPENEDSYLEMPRAGIFAVADGVGGAQAGEVASQMAMEILGEAFANLPVSADAESVMRAAIEQANTAIFQMAHELPQLASMATTIVALHLSGNIATIGHVGDSRLYRVDRDGEIYRETDDHSMVAEEVRAGRMTEEQAENHPSKNIISRAVGAEATVEPDLKTIMVEPGTAFMLCSDGITRHVGDQEIKGVLTFGGSPADICDYLKQLCYQRGAEDNLTAVVVKLAPQKPQPPVAQMEIPAAPAEQHEVEIEEMTVATARSSEPAISAGEAPAPELQDLDQDTGPLDIDVPRHGQQASPVAIDIEELFEPQPPPVVSNETIEIVERDESGDRTNGADKDAASPPFSTSKNSESADAGVASGIKSVLTALLMLVIGSAVGIGVYHYLFVRPQLEQQTRALPPITEMESRNQQLSAFEDNRRTVDKFPAEALAQFGASPSDAEDYYLVGRAHLLLGQYVEAKKAFLDSKARIAAGDVDQNNRKTLETEIALAMTVLNDTTVQTILKSQLNQGANTASNSAVPQR